MRRRSIPVCVALTVVAALAPPLAAGVPASAAAADGRILYRPPGGLSSGLFTVNPDGTGAKAIPNTVGAYEPALSPDGLRVAFVKLDAGSHGELYTIDLDGSNAKQLTHNQVQDGQPDWSPDGSTLVFYEDVPTAGNPRNYEIFTLPSTGGTPKRLTNAPVDDESPRFSPDGKQVAFISDRDAFGCNNTDNVWVSADEAYTMSSTGASPARVPVGSPADNFSVTGVAWGKGGLAVERDGGYTADIGLNCVGTYSPDDIYLV